MHHSPIKQAQLDYQHLEEVRQVVAELIKANAAFSAEFMRRYQISDNQKDLEVSKELYKLIELLRETEKEVDLDSELHALLASRRPLNTSVLTRILRWFFSFVGKSPAIDQTHPTNSIQHQTRM